MKDENRALFRTDAIRQYTQSRENSVLPRIASPRSFIFLWSLLGLLSLLGVASISALFTKLSVYTDENAVIMPTINKNQQTPAGCAGHS